MYNPIIKGFLYQSNTGLDTQTKLAPGMLSIFPNPVAETLYVHLKDFPKEEVVLNIFDLNGRLILSKSIEVSDKMTVVSLPEIETLPQGTYLIQAISERNVSELLKFVKAD